MLHNRHFFIFRNTFPPPFFYEQYARNLIHATGTREVFLSFAPGTVTNRFGFLKESGRISFTQSLLVGALPSETLIEQTREYFLSEVDPF
jgi:hypothetical protein